MFVGSATMAPLMAPRSRTTPLAAPTPIGARERETAAHELTPAALLRAAQRGERGAQARLFNLHRERVARHALRMTGDADAVDDLVQEVFIAAFAGLSRFRRDAKIETWLHTITVNKVRSWWEASRRRRVRELRGLSRSDESPETPEDEVSRRRHLERLYDALGRLPHRYREAFVARAIEGMPLKEASEVLGVGVSTLSYRTRRAEDLLCDALGVARREP